VSRLGLGLAAIGRPAYINLGRARDLPAARTPEALYRRTAELLDAAGFRAEVVDWSMFGLGGEAEEARAQIARVEEISDAYHLTVGDRDVVVAYLLEITAKANGDARAARLPGNGPPRAR
jgi:hypothetical protein